MKALLKAKDKNYMDRWVVLNEENELVATRIYFNSKEYASVLNEEQIEELKSYPKSERYEIVFFED